MPTTYGFTLSSEEHRPSDLVSYAQRAEKLGFSFVSLSDHYPLLLRRRFGREPQRAHPR